MHETNHDQSVDRLDRVDAVAPRDWDAGRCADRFATVQHAADRLHRQLVDRHADQRQRKQRRAAHRVNIGDRIRCGDAAEVERIVDDRHEEIGGRDDRLLVVQPIHRRVVGRFDADEQFLRHNPRSVPQRAVREHVAQYSGRDLAAAAAAVAELGQADRWFGCGHDNSRLALRTASLLTRLRATLDHDAIGRGSLDGLFRVEQPSL